MESKLDVCIEESLMTGGRLCFLSRGGRLRVLSRGVTTVCRCLGRWLWPHCVGCYKNGVEGTDEREISRNDEILKPIKCVRQRGEVKPEANVSSYIYKHKEVKGRDRLGENIMNSC